MQPYGGAAITVTANYVALLDATPLPRQFYWEYYEGTFERNFPGKSDAACFPSLPVPCCIRNPGADRMHLASGMQLPVLHEVNRQLVRASTLLGAGQVFKW